MYSTERFGLNFLEFSGNIKIENLDLHYLVNKITYGVFDKKGAFGGKNFFSLRRNDSVLGKRPDKEPMNYYFCQIFL